VGFFDTDSGSVKLKTEPVAMETKIVDVAPTKVEIKSLPPFIFKEASNSDKYVVVVYGEKGASKTSTALGFPGTIAALSFDMKTSVVKSGLYKGDSRIKVYDTIEFFDENPDTVLRSAYDTYEYINFILDNIEKKYIGKIDWIVIDGLEIFSGITENVMRFRNGLRPFEGISNRNIWKERKLLMRKVHNRAASIANKGIIYTTYSDVEELVDDGNMVSRKKVPKWADIVLWLTDIVIFVDSKQGKEGRRFIATIENSKVDSFLKTGAEFDLTGKRIADYIKKK